VPTCVTWDTCRNNLIVYYYILSCSVIFMETDKSNIHYLRIDTIYCKCPHTKMVFSEQKIFYTDTK